MSADREQAREAARRLAEKCEGMAAHQMVCVECVETALCEKDEEIERLGARAHDLATELVDERERADRAEREPCQHCEEPEKHYKA